MVTKFAEQNTSKVQARLDTTFLSGGQDDDAIDNNDLVEAVKRRKL